MTNIQVSIIIVSFNTKKQTLDCLNSIFSTFSKKQLSTLEVIVVDNASWDGSPQAIGDEFPEVILIANGTNKGFAAANNQGMEQASGEFIFLLNSDTEILQPNTFTKLIEVTKHDPRVGAVVPQLLNTDKSVQASVMNLPTVPNAIKEFWQNQTDAYSKYIPNTQKTTQVEAAVMAAMLIPRMVIDQVGKLDEGYFMYFEDIEFSRRLAQAGFKIFYQPEVQVLHHHGVSGKKVASNDQQWKRLIPSSRRYHGWFVHTLLFFILWLGQKKQKIWG